MTAGTDAISDKSTACCELLRESVAGKREGTKVGESGDDWQHEVEGGRVGGGEAEGGAGIDRGMVSA